MAQHFKKVGEDTHSLYTDGNANMKAKAFQNKYDEHFSSQIQVIVIEEVNLPLLRPLRRKEWQLSLVKASGKLNCALSLDIVVLIRKMNALITNKRLANKLNKTPMSSSLPALSEPSPTQKLPPYTHPVMDPPGVRGVDQPVWRSQTVSNGVMTGWKILDFLVKFAAQEAYLLECSKYKLFSGTK